MRFVATALALLALTPGSASAVCVRKSLPRTDVLFFRYRAHDGLLRPAWLLLPADYRGARLPLVISPHGRGTSARANERLWGDLPGLGGFAVEPQRPIAQFVCCRLADRIAHRRE